MIRYYHILLVLLPLVFFSACKKNEFISSSEARVFISADTLKFDTVFTTTGSITQSFKIINENNQKLLLNQVKLMGGPTSAYKINVNGQAVPEVDNLEIAANDSIYIFVSVTINPNLSSLPFIVSDSIQVSYNAVNRFVQLQAYGQNANFLSNRVISGNVTWTNNLPYVILGSIRIDTTATLTIQPGCRIYAHANAPFLVDGSLLTNGTFAAPVVFTGDRLDEDYRSLPASWPGIYFRGSSKNNTLKFTIVKNAYQAVVAEQPSGNANPKLILHQCTIDNAYDAGLLCVNSSVQADNSLISNCGSDLVLNYGGDYTFTHCTVAAYSNRYVNHKNPVLSVSDAILQNGSLSTASLNATFRNNIFWGDAGYITDEVVVSRLGTGPYTVFFDHNLYRVTNDPPNATLTGSIKNLDPAFDSVDVVKNVYDFRITKNLLAPGINKGVTTSFTKDLDDKNRNNLLPDLGCYEKQ